MCDIKRRAYRYSSLFLLLCLIGIGAMGCCNARDKHTIIVDGHKRTFLLHVPNTYDGTTPMPLVMALHQFTDTSRGMRKLTGFDCIADAEGFLVAYPQGRFRTWNADGEGRTDDVAFLLALVDWVGAHYNLDEQRVYATGASAGGMMSQYLVRHTDRITAIAPVMGAAQPSVFESGTHPGAMPVLMIHGTADPVVPYGEEGVLTDLGRQGVYLSVPDNAATWAMLNGCEGAPDTIPQPDPNPCDTFVVDKIVYPCEAGPEVILFRVGDGGHTWPGRKNKYPAFIVGKTCMDLDASQEIWDFFARQSRPIP
jgi:polyhydroxybutyrate depolymerase